MDATYSIQDGSVLIALPDNNTLTLEAVTSSRFVAIGYDERLRLAYLAFKLDNVYEYQGVEPDTWEGLLEAPSKGSYAIANIIGKPRAPIYPYRKILAAGDSFADAADSIAQVKAQPSPDDTIPELPEKDEELKDRAIAVKAAAAALTTLDANRQVVILTPEAYAQAANKLQSMKAERALVWARLMRVYDPAYATYLEARKLRDEAVAPYDEAEQLLKKGMLAYTVAEKRAREAAERAERERLEAQERERARTESEQNAHREAEYAEAQGEPELAKTIRETPLPVAPRPIAPVVMEKAVPAVKGVALKEKWTFRIVDATQIPLDHRYYTLDEGKILRIAKDLKLHANIPGVEVYDEGSIASTRGKK